MSTISTNAIQSVAATLDLGVQGNIKAKMNADNTFSSVIPGFGDTQFPEFKCRAWVNFDGTTGAIRGAGNVTSVTRRATSLYTVNFTSPMPDTNYNVVTGVGQESDRANNLGVDTNTVLITTTQVNLQYEKNQLSALDNVFNGVSVFR